MNKAAITDHAIGRMKRRGITRSANNARQKSINAYNIGLCYDDAVGNVKSYLGYLLIRNRDLGNRKPKVCIYGEHVYIFNARKLITVYQTPAHIREDALQQYRQKKNNVVQLRAIAELNRLEYAARKGYNLGKE